MTDLITLILATNPIELIAVLCNIAYVVLAAKENIACWYFAFIATALSIYLFSNARLVMESGLNFYYLIMAIVGWWQWRYGSQKSTQLSISKWSIQRHFFILLLIAFLTLTSGWWLSHHSQAALPYLDSFTTWSAIITTWMVAKKILENWLYWIIIDLFSIWLYSERALYLYATLSALYTLIALFAYQQWRKNYHAQT